jgi:K+ transporter
MKINTTISWAILIALITWATISVCLLAADADNLTDGQYFLEKLASGVSLYAVVRVWKKANRMGLLPTFNADF